MVSVDNHAVWPQAHSKAIAWQKKTPKIKPPDFGTGITPDLSVVPHGGMLRMSRHDQGMKVASLKYFHSVHLRNTDQSWQNALPMVHGQYTMHGLPHSRLFQA